MSFPYRNQPFKALYISWTVITLLVKLPIWVAANAIPAWRRPPSWPLKRFVTVKILRTILNFLYDHIDRSIDSQVRARWEPYTVVLWDNRVTAHVSQVLHC